MRTEDIFTKIHYKSTQLYADFKGGMSSRWVYDYINTIRVGIYNTWVYADFMSVLTFLEGDWLTHNYISTRMQL